jgi:ribosomal protein L40E
MMYFLAVLNDSDGPLLIALAVAALVVILATSSSKKRPTASAERPHTCRGCGTVHPGYAQFCRRCGQRLD